MTRALSIRARLAPSPEPPLDRFHDGIVADLIAGGDLAQERFPVRWSDSRALEDLARAKLRPLPRALGEEMLEYHRRLGASPQSLAALERLARGEAVCAIAGQQPAPLGGPLYSLHKIAATVGLATVIAERTGIPCVPMFWTHGEDSDFAEVRGAHLADHELRGEDLAIPSEAHRDGGMVGSIPVGALAALEARAIDLWSGLPEGAAAAALIRDAAGKARDLAESTSALVLALFAEAGVVVADPRLPAFRSAARPIIDRYLSRADELRAATVRAGEMLERRVGRRPLNDASLESFVFAIEDGARHKVSASEAHARGDRATWSPSVALRPAVQDGVFPTVAMACGAGEIAYLAQLREVFEGVEVRAACPVPRLSATWLPPAAVALLEASAAEPWELVLATDAVLRRLAERELPEEVGGFLERIRAEAGEGLIQFAERARGVDASLPQLVESARGKVDYQYARLADGLIGKARLRLERRHPEWSRLRGYLLPGDRLQERRLASLEIVAYRGRGVTDELARLGADQARRLVQGEHHHLILEL